MRTARLIGALGRTLITVGVLTFLFVGYQLWGTGIQEARAQSKLDSQFEKLLSTTTSSTGPTSSTAIPASTTSVPASTTSTTAIPLPTYGNGDVIARIEAPAIGLDKKIVQGVDTDDLRKGPGHYPTTAMPGQKGNASIAGHRTTYGAPFKDIDQLHVGDEIRVTTVQGTFTYKVFDDVGDLTGHRIVKPSETWVLNDFGDNRLTLTACHPKYSAEQRIVVVAKLVEAPAAAPPTSTTAAPAVTATTVAGAATPPGQLPGEDPATVTPAESPTADTLGLGWHTKEFPATLLWALVTAATLVGISIAAKRWRRLLTYAISALPLLVVVYLLFEHLDRLLPTG
jgi:sortase A